MTLAILLQDLMKSAGLDISKERGGGRNRRNNCVYRVVFFLGKGYRLYDVCFLLYEE